MDGHSRVRLAQGIELEPFADGTAILFSPERGETISLNLSAALLCAHADGILTLEEAREQVAQLFPGESVGLDPFLSLARELVERGFLVVEG
jgi:hypothetical protein